AERRTRSRSLRGAILARPTPSCADDDDRVRLPPASAPRNTKAGKKESTGHRPSRLCQPGATPSSDSSLDYLRDHARIVENGFATSSGMNKSAKVVLVITNFLSGRANAGVERFSSQACNSQSVSYYSMTRPSCAAFATASVRLSASSLASIAAT